MNWLLSLFSRRSKQEFIGPVPLCEECSTGFVTQPGEFRCYKCWNRDNIEAFGF